MQALLTKMIKALKPGGTFIVVFPTARDATGTDDTGKLHRIDKEVVRGYITGRRLRADRGKPDPVEQLRT